MTCDTTVAKSRPVLDEATFQRLLSAAHVMQKCTDCLVKADGAIAENVRVKPPTQEPVNIQVPDAPLEPPISVDQADIKPWEPHSDSLIPPETAHLLSTLASQLRQQRIWTDPERTTQAVAGVQEIRATEEQTPRSLAETKGFEQPPSAPTDMVTSVQSAVPGEMRTQISLSNDFFGRTAMVFAIAAVFLLGASAYRLLSGPDRLALPSEVVQPRAPLERIAGVARQRVGVHSTYGNEALAAKKNAQVTSGVRNTIRADHRLQTANVQVRASDGIVTLSGNVGSDAERVAAAQDAAQIGGFEALLNKLQVVNSNRQGPIVSTSTSRSTIVSSTSVAPSAVSPEAHPKGSQAGGESSVSSRASGPPVDRIPRTPEQITVPYGTMLAVRLAETLSSGLNQPGDTFLASLVSPIVVGDRVVIPAGGSVKGRIVDARNARRFSGRAALVIEVTQLAYNGRTYELHSSPYSEQGASRNTYAAAATTGGAGVGAIIGTVVGRGKGAVIGAVLGAAAGTGVQALTKRAPAQLSAESTLEFRLETPLTLQVQSARPDLAHAPSSSSDRPVLKQRSANPLTDTEPLSPRQPR